MAADVAAREFLVSITTRAKRGPSMLARFRVRGIELNDLAHEYFLCSAIERGVDHLVYMPPEEFGQRHRTLRAARFKRINREGYRECRISAAAGLAEYLSGSESAPLGDLKAAFLQEPVTVEGVPHIFHICRLIVNGRIMKVSLDLKPAADPDESLPEGYGFIACLAEAP